MRNDFFNYAKRLVDEQVYMNDIDKLQEENRYYNWYHGYTLINRAYTDWDSRQNYRIMTSATSGVVTTQYYGEQFWPELVESNLVYDVTVIPTKSVSDNKNVSMF